MAPRRAGSACRLGYFGHVLLRRVCLSSTGRFGLSRRTLVEGYSLAERLSNLVSQTHRLDNLGLGPEAQDPALQLVADTYFEPYDHAAILHRGALRWVPPMIVGVALPSRRQLHHHVGDGLRLVDD